jgi:hypothetical protein
LAKKASLAHGDAAIVGLELVGSENRPSGFAVLKAHEIHTAELYGYAEVIAAIEKPKRSSYR